MCVMRSGEEVAFPSEPSPKAPAKQMLSAWTANAPREARAPDLEVDSLTLSRSNQLSYGSLWSTVAVSTPAWRAREDAHRHVGEQWQEEVRRILWHHKRGFLPKSAQ